MLAKANAVVGVTGVRVAMSARPLAPVQVDGIWCLELSYTGDLPAGVPDRWHGHKVILRKVEPPSA